MMAFPLTVDLVAIETARFATEAKKFIGLEPTYVRSFLSGILEAIRNKIEFDWQYILMLCRWVIEQSKNIHERQYTFGNFNPGWGWTRRTIASLISAGLESNVTEIPFSFREEVWEILKPLTDDLQPSPEYEERYGGTNMEPSTLAINTTRGEAMLAVIRYAL
jgi:hypothetical protein